MLRRELSQRYFQKLELRLDFFKLVIFDLQTEHRGHCKKESAACVPQESIPAGLSFQSSGQSTERKGEGQVGQEEPYLERIRDDENRRVGAYDVQAACCLQKMRPGEDSACNNLPRLQRVHIQTMV